MRPTDIRDSIFSRSPHSLSRHSIESKSPPFVSPTPHSKPKPKTHLKNSSISFDKQKLSYISTIKHSATDTPQFSNDPSKYVYNCQQVYALLESVKIERNYESSLELIEIIKDTISKLSKKRNLEGEIDALLRVLSNIERKLGFRHAEEEQKRVEKEKQNSTLKDRELSELTVKVQEQKPTHYKYKHREILKQKERQPEMIHQNQIQFSLVSNWKQITGKQVVYTNFSLLDEDDSIDLSASQKQSQRDKQNEKQKQKENKSTNINSRVNKYSLESNTSNVLITDLNLEIEMLDSLLEGKLKKKPKSVHTSISSETIKKTRPKKMLY